jgi:diguanylate cyclase (GGDEF)-like protein
MQGLQPETPALTSTQKKSPHSQVAAPELWVTSQNAQERWGTRILLLVVAAQAVVSFLMPRLSGTLRLEVSFLPQLLIAVLALVVILEMRQKSHRTSLRDVSKALMDSIAYIERLEEYSFIDPETHTFQRSYLDHLFREESQFSNRNGSMTTLCLFEVRSDGQQSASEESIRSAASILRSNFRGSDSIVRYATDQFLVLLSDTNDQQAAIALNRLEGKVEFWDIENDQASIMLRQQVSSCLPGEDLWVKLRAIKEKLETEPALWKGSTSLAASQRVQASSQD